MRRLYSRKAWQTATQRQAWSEGVLNCRSLLLVPA
jgi:hypothetical protein